jgi:hypothetical protein
MITAPRTRAVKTANAGINNDWKIRRKEKDGMAALADARGDPTKLAKTGGSEYFLPPVLLH